MLATFGHGISGYRALSSGGRRRLASEMISIPRSTIHRLGLSGLKSGERRANQLAADYLDGLDDVSETGDLRRRRHSKYLQR